MRVMATTLAVAAAGALAGLGSAATTASPALRATTTKPLVVVGTGFAPGERVTVTALTSLRTTSVRVTASRLGAFRARLGMFTQPCGRPFAVRARGAKGSVASMRLAVTLCVPPPID